MSLVTFVAPGVLSSVHAFALDPARHLHFGLRSLRSVVDRALRRARALEPGEPFDLVSRESSLLLNNVLLVSALATVFIGTFYPLFIDAIGDDKISVALRADFRAAGHPF
jgi:cytochrome c-type biogenesis protein CcmF